MHAPDDAYREAGWWTGERLVDRVAANVLTAPDSLALVDEATRWSLDDLWKAAGRQADALTSEIGCSEATSDRRVVLIDLPNNASWLVTFLAVLRSGHVPATIPATTSARHLAHVIDLIGPTLMVTSPATSPGSANRAVTEATDSARACPGVAEAMSADLRLLKAPGRPPLVAEPLDRTDHLMFTSSTTGPPKAVSHSENSLGTLNKQFAARFSLDSTTPIFMPSPLGHSVGAIHGARLALYLGAPLVLQDCWDARTALQIAADHRPSFVAAATPFLVDLVEAAPLDCRPKFETVSTFLCGGAQVPPALIRQCRHELPHTFVTPLWGMTEGGVTTCIPGDAPELVELSVGTALPGLELRVAEVAGEYRSVGEGELVMRGPGVFNGYLGQPDLYDEARTPDGFFRTGDLARIRADGYVEITGRTKDLIIRGGVNISPVDTENTLATHPAVRAVAVIGWPDPRLGERLCAVVEATERLTLDDLISCCRTEGLAKRFWPERLELVDRFPRTAAGKIRKQALRDDLVARASTGDDT